MIKISLSIRTASLCPRQTQTQTQAVAVLSNRYSSEQCIIVLPSINSFCRSHALAINNKAVSVSVLIHHQLPSSQILYIYIYIYPLPLFLHPRHKPISSSFFLLRISSYYIYIYIYIYSSNQEIYINSSPTKYDNIGVNIRSFRRTTFSFFPLENRTFISNCDIHLIHFFLAH